MITLINIGKDGWGKNCLTIVWVVKKYGIAIYGTIPLYYSSISMGLIAFRRVSRFVSHWPAVHRSKAGWQLNLLQFLISLDYFRGLLTDQFAVVGHCQPSLRPARNSGRPETEISIDGRENGRRKLRQTYNLVSRTIATKFTPSNASW